MTLLRIIPTLLLAGVLSTATGRAQTGMAEAPYQKTVIDTTLRLQIVHRAGPASDALVEAVTGAVEFYTNLFGKLPADSLTVVEHQTMPFSTPGVVFLPTITSMQGAPADTTLSADDLTLVAESLARLWWDEAVTFADSAAMIREGVIRYSALLYVFQETESAAPLFTDLQRAANVLTAEEPPTGRAWDQAHGLWLMHMLRNMMIDQTTMSDEAYQTTLRSLYHRSKGRAPVTVGHLRADIETVLGIDVGWFIDEWIPLTTIPIYAWAWQSVPGLDGTYANTIRVAQTNVPDGFQMYIPINVVLQDGTSTRYRIKMVGTEATMELPATQQRVARIVFNEFASVLCVAEEEEFTD